MFKNIIFISLCLLIASNSIAQTFFQKDTPITITTGGTLFIGGDYETNHYINNDGTITISGDLTNYSTTGIFVNQTGEVILNGNKDQNINSLSHWQFNKLTINKPEKNIYLGCSILVDSVLSFYAGNIYLDTHNVNLGYSGNLSNENETSRIFATGGKVILKRDISFPASSDDIGGVGLFINAPSQVFGVSEITRGHSVIDNAVNGSIPRWFYVKPGIESPVKMLAARYFDNDGVMDETSLLFYSKGPTTLNFLPKGGVADVSDNLLSSFYFLNFREELVTIAPITNNSTCDNTNPHYVKARFLISSEAVEGDSVYFVNLSLPDADSVGNIWKTGDGYNYNTSDIVHIYENPGDYYASLVVSNVFCADAETKAIHINQNLQKYNQGSVVSEILNSFLYYPNPVINTLNLQLELTDFYAADLAIIDIFGKTILNKKYNQKLVEDNYDLSNLSSGLYLLKLEVLGKVYSYRIVKQ